MFPGRGTHGTPGKHIPSDMCFRVRERTRETHFTRVMCFLEEETHMASDMCSRLGERISLRICVSRKREHISLVICVPE